MEEIYFELTSAILLSNEKLNEKQTNYYNLIVAFFNNYYTSQIENLQDQLRSLESASKFIQSLKKLFNSPTIKMIQFALEKKTEKEKIKIQAESLIAKKERYNKLNQIVYKSISY